jgi:hypothetical protein
VIQNDKKYQKIRAKSAKFGFLLVVWPPGELHWAFMQIVLCCFFLCNLLCPPSRVYPQEEAQIWLLRHLTQSRDGALNFMLKLSNFYRPHLLSNWAKNWCASLIDIELEKYKKIRAKGAKFGFLLVAWPRGELRCAFVLIVLCCFFHCLLLCLPSRVCQWIEAEIQLLSHLTQSRDGALNFML